MPPIKKNKGEIKGNCKKGIKEKKEKEEKGKGKGEKSKDKNKNGERIKGGKG